MTDALRVLIVEDSPDDALLLEMDLRRQGVALAAFRRVETRETFEEALSSEPWDLVLADYHLPAFGGVDALDLLNKSGRDIPFILMSGMIGEEAAVAALKNGANDFVRKDNLARLAPAIRREVAEAGERRRRREAERDLAKSEEKFRNLFHHASDAIFYLDEAGLILEANMAATVTLGQERDDLIGRALSSIIAPEYWAATTASLQALTVGPAESLLLESALHDRQGQATPVEFHMRRVDQEPPGRILMIARDIAERKQAERRIVRLANLYAALSQTNQAIIKIRVPEALFAEVCRVTVEYGHFDVAWIGFREATDGRLKIAACAGIDALTVAVWLEECAVLRQMVGRLVCDGVVQTDNGYAFPRIFEDVAVAPGGSLALFPLTRFGPVVGCLALFAREPAMFDSDVTHLGKEIAGDISFALETFNREQERCKAEEELRLSATVFESSEEGIMIADAEKRIISINRAFREITGYSEDEVIGRRPNFLRSGQHDAVFYARMWQAIDSTGRWSGEIVNRRKNGQLYPEWLTISRLETDGRATHYIGTFSDITQRRQAEDQIRYLAHYDPLTGLPNRALLEGRIELLFARARRAGGEIALLFFDLDRFKTINDSLGHDVGDRLLQAVADRLRACTRESDLLTRWGGDEFVLVISDQTQPDAVATVANKILTACLAPFSIGSHELVITLSIGISLYPKDGTDIHSLIKHADAAMYQAKDGGRNTYRLFTPAMNESAVERLAIDNDLRQAIGRGELSVHYQPQWDVDAGRIVGMEALMRWTHPTRGAIPPAHFIPLAEDSGLIVKIGHWVLEAACRQNAEWQRIGLSAVPVAVNLSARQFRQPDFVVTVEDVLATTGLPARYLELEITERVWMREVPAARATLDDCKRIGVAVAIDDFGTGFSSLSYLQNLPIDRLKIDRGFVAGTPRDQGSVAIVRAIIAMAHSFGISVIAEGVETEAQADFLRSEQCNVIQGYYFSRPLPAGDMAALLRRLKADAVERQ